MGDYVGGDNSFDFGQPYEMLCSWEQIDELVKDYGCKLGWHTWSHPDLTKMDNFEEILNEVTPPRRMKYFAYPYGRFDKTVVEAVEMAGFKEAYSVHQGDGSEFKRNREYL